MRVHAPKWRAPRDHILHEDPSRLSIYPLLYSRVRSLRSDGFCEGLAQVSHCHVGAFKSRRSRLSRQRLLTACSGFRPRLIEVRHKETRTKCWNVATRHFYDGPPNLGSPSRLTLWLLPQHLFFFSPRCRRVSGWPLRSLLCGD